MILNQIHTARHPFACGLFAPFLSFVSTLRHTMLACDGHCRPVSLSYPGLCPTVFPVPARDHTATSRTQKVADLLPDVRHVHLGSQGRRQRYEGLEATGHLAHITTQLYIVVRQY